MKGYRIAKTSKEQVHTDKLLNQLLINRDLREQSVVEGFLAPDYNKHRHDPYLLPGMNVAVQRLGNALKNKEQLVIFADYDCDGIPGAVIANDFLTAVGCDHFSVYIPHRHYEGFGLSVEAVEKLSRDGARLIVTIDCGTSSIAAVARANELGVDVIITDHHEAGSTLPEAVAIVNPKVAEGYPFIELCGSGVFFKLVEALIATGEYEIPLGKEKWWLDMVGIATINDMVPLIGENRVYAHYGLQVLRKSRRPGLQQLLKKARSSQPTLTEDDVGFTIGPRINAASRMDTPEDAYRLLATSEISEANEAVVHLEKLNNERKGLVASMTREAHARLKESGNDALIIVIGNPAWRPSLVGLTASKLAEEYQKPAFVWGRDGNGIIKGSCRSDGLASVIALMEGAEDCFMEKGGHRMAGGFAVSDEQILSLERRLVESHNNQADQSNHTTPYEVDCVLSLEDINRQTLSTLNQLAPYGVGNPKPLFIFTEIIPTKVERFGKGKEHLKLTFDLKDKVIEAIAFFKTEKNFQKIPQAQVSLTLLAHIEESFFMGRQQTRLRIVEIV